MLWIHSPADKHGSQQGKNISLQECDKKFQKTKPDGGRNRDGSDKDALKNEYEPQKRQNDDVPSDHIGKQTNAERKGLREQAQNFNHKHERHKPKRQTVRDVCLNIM